MLRVIVADDEPVIVRGLKKIISWEDFGLSVIDEARDGQELWEKVKTQRPDLVVSDIYMPDMTGLEFMSRLKSENMAVQVIFISGYQRFEYVQEAIRLGAVDYLLKPVLKDAMEEAVRKALQRLQNQEKLKMFREEKNELQELVSRMNTNSEYAPEELYESFCRMGIDYKGKVFVCVCFYLSKETEKRLRNEQYGMMELVKFSVFNQIQRFFRERRKGFPLKRDNECLKLLCVLDPSERSVFLEEYVYKALVQTETEMGVGLRACTGSFSDKAHELEYLYNSSKFAYEMRYFLEQKIICADNIHKTFESSFEDYEAVCRKILNGLVTRKPEIMEDFQECIDLVESLHYGNRYAVINRCILFAGSLHDDLKEYGAVSEEDEAHLAEFMEKLRTADTFMALRDVFLCYYEGLAERIQANRGIWDHPDIARVTEYIRTNYEKDINMQNMAELACVNPVYFSTLFKKTTGKNFKKFLTDVRMEEAKKLVITTDMKTYALAERVGYQNARQFAEVFRKYYGCSPSEYKRKLRDKNDNE